MFLVIRQKRNEQGVAQKERRSAIPLVRAKFNTKLAGFIAQCFKVIAETNHDGGEAATAKRDLAKQMLHLFIGTRLIYDKTKPELPNIVYSNPDLGGTGDTVRLNGTIYNMHDAEDFEKFKAELEKCEIMPSWGTLNATFRTLQSSSFKFLYDHFSITSDPFKVAIDGVDSGLTITKDNLNKDTLVQWMIKNHFFATRFFIKNDVSFSLHNLTLGNAIEAKVKEEVKEGNEAVGNAPIPKEPTAAPEGVIGLEEGEVIVDDEDDEDDDEYSAPLVKVDKNYRKIKELKTAEDAIKLISKRYKRLAKLMNIALARVGSPKIEFIVSDEQGEWKEINGVMRQHRARTHRNEDKSWRITFYQGNPDVIKTLAHEMVHVFTTGAIKKMSGKYTQTLRVIYAACLDVMTKEERQEYGLKSPDELIAEFFANPVLQRILKRRPALPESILDTFLTKEEQTRPRNMFESILRWISNFWRTKILRREPSMYYQVYDIMEMVFSEAEVSDVVGEVSADEYGDRSRIRSKFENLFEIATSKLAGGVSIKNHVTGKTYKIQNATTQDQVINAAKGMLTELILHADITPLGKNIEKFKFSTKDIIKQLEQNRAFSEWFQRTFSYHPDPLIAELAKVTRVTDENGEPVLYEAVKTVEKEGKKSKKKLTFAKLDLEKWGAITPFMDQFMAELRIETVREADNRVADQEIEHREDGKQNDQGYYSSEDYEVDPFDRASQEVKWLFSTIPYGTIEDDKHKPSTNRNKYGFREFIPFRNVYGKVLYYTSDCTTTDAMLKRFAKLAESGPDKALFKYMQEKLQSFINNKWLDDKLKGQKSNPTRNEDGKVFNADAESMLIKVVRALRQQQNDFKWAVVEDKTDERGDKTKDISIKTTLYQKGVIMAMNGWMDQLSTGLTGVLKYNSKKSQFEFQDKDENLFYKIYSDLFIGDDSFINAYNKSKMDHPQDVTVNWKYLDKPTPFSEITADDVKTYLHNALLKLGVDL